MLDLYKNIKLKRLNLGLTQSELAKRMGYADKSMIAKIENGKVDLQQSKIVAFAKALGTTPGDLMGWTESAADLQHPASPAKTLRPDESTLLSHYNNLNDTGKEQAQLQVMQLTQIPAYQIKGDAEETSCNLDVG